MKKSRWILTLAGAVVIAGLGIGAAAYLGSAGVVAQAPGLPATTAWLPAGATVVGHVDLSALLNSPLRDQWPFRDLGHDELDREDHEGLEKFRETTGLDPFTDLHRASFAMVTSTAAERDGHPRPESWGIAIQGVFDPNRLIAKLEEEADVERQDYHGTTIYYPTPRVENDDEHDNGRAKPAFAFATDDTLLVGEREYIRRMLDTGTGRAASAASAVDQSWGEGTFLHDTLWIAAAPENGLGDMLPEGAEIPPIQSIALSARLDTDVAVRARGKAADLDAATKLADVVRGFIALGSLQRGDNADLGMILDSIRIEQFENEVDVSLTVPYETLERLSKQADPNAVNPN